MTAIIRDKKSSVELSNRSESPKKIIIEPWAEELLIPPHDRWLIVCDSPASEPVPIDIYDDAIVVYGIKQSILRVYSDGKQIWEGFPPLE